MLCSKGRTLPPACSSHWPRFQRGLAHACTPSQSWHSESFHSLPDDMRLHLRGTPPQDRKQHAWAAESWDAQHVARDVVLRDLAPELLALFGVLHGLVVVLLCLGFVVLLCLLIPPTPSHYHLHGLLASMVESNLQRGLCGPWCDPLRLLARNQLHTIMYAT